MSKNSNRINKLRQKLAENGLDAVLISQPENRYYLSGFTGSAGFLLVSQTQAVLAVDFRYLEQAGLQAPDFRIFQIKNGLNSWFPALVSGMHLKSLGFESGNITVAAYHELTRILEEGKSGISLVPTTELVESLRAIKEPEEIERITRAAEISDAASDYIESVVHTGLSEQAIAWELEKFMREQGSQALPFEIIVASGPNSALPHARPSSRTVKEGEPIVIDIGARVDGYASDLSRTICIGADDTFNKIYRVVLDAQLAALSIIEEGITGDQADGAARTVIQKAGYGESFGHALGHGVGLAPHESPRLGPGSENPLRSGMVFTIEPGIYLPDWGGVRIEDLVTIENGRVKLISKARKLYYDKRQ